MIRQMTAGRSSSACVHLPASTPFYTSRYKNSSALELRKGLPSRAAWLTQDGWIFNEWQILLPVESLMSPVYYGVTDFKPGNDGIWRYTFNNEERQYPLLCRPVNWAELELLFLFS